MRRFWSKYKIGIVITAAFLLFVIFLAPGNLLDSARLSRSIKKMQREQQVYRERAREDSTFLENLKNDEFLEKYAREKFYMKRKGEEIYLIE